MNVKQAVQSARAYLLDVFEEEKPHGPMLEEVEWSDTEQEWQVTLSFNRPLPPTPFDAFPRSEKIYKTFKIDNATGTIKSVKIREISQ